MNEKTLNYMPQGGGRPGRLSRTQREYEMEMEEFHQEIFSVTKICLVYIAGILTGAAALLAFLW